MGTWAKPEVGWVIVGLLAGLGISTSEARPSRPDTVSQDYLLALGTADRFLHAWQMRD